MGIRVLHTGDLHIGSFPGPERGGERLRGLEFQKEEGVPLRGHSLVF